MARGRPKKSVVEKVKNALSKERRLEIKLGAIEGTLKILDEGDYGIVVQFDKMENGRLVHRLEKIRKE